MKSCIASIGISNPHHKVAQSQIYDFMVAAHQLTDHESSRLKKIYDGSGIEFRHSVIGDFGKAMGEFEFFSNTKNLEPFPSTQHRATLYQQTAIGIAIEAVTDCLKNLPDLKKEEISHLITVSCTGMYAPGLDIDLVEQLGLNSHVERTCINFMGCYGAFNALKMADYICRADSLANVLIVDIELCTLHFQKENSMDNWVANSLFADGASAVLVCAEDRTNKGFALKSFHSQLISSAKDDMAWSIGNFGFEMRLSTQIAKKVKKTIHSIADTLLSKVSMGINDIQRFAIHPGGRRILEVCEEEFQKTTPINQNSYEVLRNHGNMSSATILFVLHKFWLDRENLSSMEHILSFAFGPGLTFESLLIEVQ